MSNAQAQRQDTKKMVIVIAAVLTLFVGGSATAFSLINSDINEAEQQIQQRINGSF